MAEFKLSTLGRNYVADEKITELPVIRIVFVIVTIVLGVLVLLKLTLHYVRVQNLFSKRRNPINNQALLTSIFVTHWLSYAIHSTHYADNIYRPVDYLEPQWLYVKYVMCEMEITFFANFPISIMGLIGMQGLLSALAKNDGQLVRQNCKRFIFYIVGSLLTLGHYRTEFPSHYSAFVNFTIAGEGVVTIVLGMLVGFCYWGKFSNDSNTALGANLDSLDDESTGKLLDFFDGEHGLGGDKSTSKTRRRSRTPVKSKARLDK